MGVKGAGEDAVEQRQLLDQPRASQAGGGRPGSCDNWRHLEDAEYPGAAAKPLDSSALSLLETLPTQPLPPPFCIPAFKPIPYITPTWAAQNRKTFIIIQ